VCSSDLLSPPVAIPEQTPRHSVSVAAAIVDDQGRFLVIRRADNGAWEPPGGVLEPDESIEAGLVREIEEETGLRVEPLGLSGVYKNMQRAIVALVFRCRMVSEDPHPTNEAREVAWFGEEELATYMPEAYRVRLTDALDMDQVNVRAHDGRSLVADPAATP